MPREKRFVVLGTPHHIMQRRDNRQAVFRSDADRHFYLKTLGGVDLAPGILVNVCNI